MKNKLFTRLKSLTTILVLNVIPVGFAQAGVGYEAEVLQARALSDDRRSALKGGDVTTDSLNQLYFDNSLAYIQKHAQQSTNYRYQITLALVEEAYQDDYDDLLDQYEHVLSQKNISITSEKALDDKAFFEKELATLKDNKQRKIEEFQRQFAIT